MLGGDIVIVFILFVERQIILLVMRLVLHSVFDSLPFQVVLIFNLYLTKTTLFFVEIIAYSTYFT